MGWLSEDAWQKYQKDGVLKILADCGEQIQKNTAKLQRIIKKSG